MTSRVGGNRRTPVWPSSQYDRGVSTSPDEAAQSDATGSLSWYARELYNDLRLAPMLRQLMTASCRLTNAVGGSISIIDPDAGRYTKAAEVGTACRLGQTFALHEGVTGQVIRKRQPVVLSSYREIARGHLPAGHPAWDGSVAAIPIWWRGEIVAVNVVFAGVSRPFSADEVDHLELVTQVVAPGVVVAVDREVPTGGGIRRRAAAGRGDQDPALSESGVEQVMLGLLDLADRAVGTRGDDRRSLHVAVLTRGDRSRLLLRQGGEKLVAEARTAAEPVTWAELVEDEGVVLAQPAGVEALAAEDPSLLCAPVDGPAGEAPSPFSTREREVALLLARGLSDRVIADELCLSPKTVEKHVSAVLRKTGTTSRTAAVVYCLQRGWLPPNIPVHG